MGSGWMYRVMAGLDTEEGGPGYKKSIVKPHIGGGFTPASASLDSPYGKLSSAWKIDDQKLELAVTIPANTTATVYVPVKDDREVREGVSVVMATRRPMERVGVDKSEYFVNRERWYF